MTLSDDEKEMYLMLRGIAVVRYTARDAGIPSNYYNYIEGARYWRVPYKFWYKGEFDWEHKWCLLNEAFELVKMYDTE